MSDPVIQSMLLSAAKLRKLLERPTPGVYDPKIADDLATLFESYPANELREAVRKLQGCPVHPATERISLLMTLTTHFEWMVKTGKNPLTGKTYTC